jgi:hypothetical protein
VAIVQISRITNRKGYTENLPQLAGAEFGWCTDSRQLFIGNGTLEDGAPVIGNTEILTQFSDITVLSNYTYSDIVVGYSAQTGSTTSDPVVRTVQAKLDDMASVRDFGAVGDGVADDTAAINRALYQLYCRENNTQIRRSLFFPAGTYRTSSPIIIPTYAKLVGEGANCSTIYLDTQDSSVPAYVARFGDSRQQTGVNIGTNGATPPQNIEISSMTFQSTEASDVFLVDQATQCWFDSVNFVGSNTLTEIENSGGTLIPTLIAVAFNSVGAQICSDITFDKCAFTNSSYGINTTATIKGVTVSNSVFDTLLVGIQLATNPSGFRAVHNIFDNVYSEGIFFSNIDLNVSAYNVFYNVGNSIGGTNPTAVIVRLGNDNNVSINDVFERSDADAYTYPRVQITGSTSSTGGTQMQVGRYAREAGRTFTLVNAASNQTVTDINSQYVRAFEMLYTIVRDVDIRTGRLTVVTEPVSYTDDYTENSSTGITFTASAVGDTVSIKYSATNTGDSGTLTYSISHLA